MTTPVAFNLQIKGFCNCEGHMKDLNKALRKLKNVKLSEVDSEMGIFMILTTSATDPKAIRDALKRPFSKKEIILSHKVGTSAMTVALQIDQFPNREGSIKNVKEALGVGTLDDVELLEMDPEMGLFIISTPRDPDAIKRVIEGRFPEKNIICVHLQDANLQDAQPPPQTDFTPSAPPIPVHQIWDGDHFQGIASGFFEEDGLTIYNII